MTLHWVIGINEHIVVGGSKQGPPKGLSQSWRCKQKPHEFVLCCYFKVVQSLHFLFSVVIFISALLQNEMG